MLFIFYGRQNLYNINLQKKMCFDDLLLVQFTAGALDDKILLY